MSTTTFESASKPQPATSADLYAKPIRFGAVYVDEHTKLEPRVLVNVIIEGDCGVTGLSGTKVHSLSLEFKTEAECKAAIAALTLVKNLSVTEGSTE